LGFLVGMVILFVISALYFTYTNKDILSFLKIRQKVPPNLAKDIKPGRRFTALEAIQAGKVKWRVDTYLTERLRPRLVRSVAHYDSSVLLSVFRQNHGNALIVQLMSLLLLVVLGFLIDNPNFRIPAGASILIICSVLVAITGAITYWFKEWRITVLAVVLFGINFLTSYDLFNHKNKGYGLDYTGKAAAYTYPNLDSMCQPEQLANDKANTVEILENWSDKAVREGKAKPRMVVFCVSGGGLKAAVWAMQVMQQADSLLNNRLLRNTVLISGASGGMIGAAYLRELYLRQQQGADINIYSQQYIDNISRDLLNSVAFTIVSNDLFLPWGKFEAGGYTYRKDRGYIFEQQLNENTHSLMDKRLVDYREAEKQALIPLLFLTPSIVNDGRRLIISPQGISYMTKAPVGDENRNQVEVDGVDFGRLYAEQDAYNLRFTSALRMNATYPYILPNVYLPSHPQMEVMDAGFRDNYGIVTATRFIHNFKDWIKENTSGVVLVQVIGRDKFEEVEDRDGQGALESLLNPLGIASQVLKLQEYEHDINLGYVFDLLGEDMFDVVRFVYKPSRDNERASMTFHLTKREKRDILDAFYIEENQVSMENLRKILMLGARPVVKN
ncbi:MAG: patatin-like phospholipase family protein, partial [Bacteroidota bacterium]